VTSLRTQAAALRERIRRGESIRTLVLAEDTDEDRHADYSFLRTADVYFIPAGTSKADVDARIADGAYEYVLNLSDLSDLDVVHLGAGTDGGSLYSKTSLERAGARVPRTYAIDDDIAFPVIVKPDAASASIGVTLVQSRAELVAAWRDDAELLIQEFIDGPELAVLVVEDPDGGPPTPYTIELGFARAGDILDYAKKWQTFHDHCQWRFLDDSPRSRALRSAVEEVPVQLFRQCGLAHYCRFDVRIKAVTGEPYVLDVNPYCGMFYPRHDFHSADLLVDRYIGHERFVYDLIRCDCRHILGS
jgi:hypothetical protein